MDKKYNAGIAPKKRVLISAIFIVAFIGSIASLVYYYKFVRGNAPEVEVRSGPSVQSKPGIGKPSEVYNDAQIAENQQKAEEAKKAITSNVPTLVNDNFDGDMSSFMTAGKLGSAGACPVGKAGNFKPNPEVCKVENLRLARQAGVKASELICQNCPVSALRLAGYTAGELKAAGYTAKELKDGGFTAAELLEAGFTPEELRKAGFSAATLRALGLTPQQLAAAGYSEQELVDAGIDRATAKKALATWKANQKLLAQGHDALLQQGHTAEDLLKGGLTPAELKAAGFSATELAAGGATVGALKAAGFTAKELRDAGFTASQLRRAGFDAKALHAAGFSAQQLKSAGFSDGDLVRAGVPVPKAAAKKTGSETATKKADAEAENVSNMPAMGGNSRRASREKAELEKIKAIQKYQQRQLDRAQQEAMLQNSISQMTSQARSLMSDWSRVSSQSLAQAPQEKYQSGNFVPGQNGKGSGHSNQMAKGPTIKAGTIMYGVLQTSINSDEQTPIMAKVISGRLEGATLMGSFKRVDEKLLLSFNLLNIPNFPHTIKFQGVAIDPTTSGTAMVGDVDHHYWAKYGVTFLAAFFDGIGDAVSGGTSTCQLLTSTSSSDPWCQTVYNKLNTTKSALTGLGNVGDKLSGQLQKDFGNIPPTVKIPGGTAFGLLFTSDLTLPQDLPEKASLTTMNHLMGDNR